MKQECILGLTLADGERDMQVAIAAGKVVDELSHKDRIDHEELDRTIEKHLSELVGYVRKDVRKKVIQHMVYDQCTHVIFMFPGFKGLHRKGASVLDLV